MPVVVKEPPFELGSNVILDVQAPQQEDLHRFSPTNIYHVILLAAVVLVAARITTSVIQFWRLRRNQQQEQQQQASSRNGELHQKDQDQSGHWLAHVSGSPTARQQAPWAPLQLPGLGWALSEPGGPVPLSARLGLMEDKSRGVSSGADADADAEFGSGLGSPAGDLPASTPAPLNFDPASEKAHPSPSSPPSSSTYHRSVPHGAPLDDKYSAMTVESWQGPQRAASPVVDLESTDAHLGPRDLEGGKGPELVKTKATGAVRSFIARPPPPPPLTPPAFSRAIYAFEERRPNYVASIPPGLETFSPASPSSGSTGGAAASSPSSSYIHQAGADFSGSSSSADMSSTSSTRRRSYTKTISLGGPAPTPALTFKDPYFSATSEALSSVMFSPSSFPPSNSQLPPAPPVSHVGQPYADAAVGSPEFKRNSLGSGSWKGATSAMLADTQPQLLQQLQPREIDLQGEIISVVDEATGAGWTRHTRVYGGGVCLACAAAAGTGVPGGFYGDKVRPEDRRRQ